MSANTFNSHQSKMSLDKKLTLKVPFTTIVAFVASADQDQAAQNMQPGL